MPKASDIVRILSATFTFGKRVIALTEDTHKSVLLGLLNVLTSHAGNSSAVASRVAVMEFISDVDPEKFLKYQITLTDEVKNVVCTGQDLVNLLNAWGRITTTWNVDRGGKRSVTKESPASLGSMKS